MKLVRTVRPWKTEMNNKKRRDTTGIRVLTELEMFQVQVQVQVLVHDVFKA